MKNILFVLLLFTTKPGVSQSESSVKIDWTTWENVLTKTQSASRKVMVFVTTDWAGWGKRMESEINKTQEIIKLLNNNYYVIKMDAEQKEDISISGRIYRYIPNGRRGYNELAAELLNGRMSYPAIVFLDEKLSKITFINGYQTPIKMDAILNYFAKDIYKEITFEQYWRNYKIEKGIID